MTTIKKKSYLPPIVETVCVVNNKKLLLASEVDVIFEDDYVDIVNQDAPNLELETID